MLEIPDFAEPVVHGANHVFPAVRYTGFCKRIGVEVRVSLLNTGHPLLTLLKVALQHQVNHSLFNVFLPVDTLIMNTPKIHTRTIF